MRKQINPLRRLFGSRPFLKLFLCVLIAFLVWRFGPDLFQRMQFAKIAARYDLAELSRPIKPVKGVVIETRPQEFSNAIIDKFDFRAVTIYDILDDQSLNHGLFSNFAERWTYEGDPKDHPTLHGLFGETFREMHLGLDRTSFSVEGPLKFWVHHPSHVTIDETCQITITRLTFEWPEARLIERWPLLERRFKKLFREARLHEDAEFNFLIHAANEIKQDDCGPNTEKIVEKWQRAAIEFQIETLNGRVFGAELWLF